MYSIPVEVGKDIRVDGNYLGIDLVEQILDENTVKNPAYAIAKRAKRYGWQRIPEEFILADMKSDIVILPRGYAGRLKELCRENGKRVQWIDKRTWQRGSALPFRSDFVPRDHQPLAVKMMRKWQQGIYEAPTGSGKSLTCIWLIQQLSPERTIVLVDKKDLLDQWRKEIKNWIGLKYVGKIGGGKWDDSKRITVATYQSVWAKIKSGEIDDEWFEQFDCMIADECHHTSAASIQNITSRFSARYRLGVSATPDRQTGLFEIIELILGDICHADDEDELREAGVLIKPHVEVLKTSFEFNYWGDGEYEPDDCPVPGCKAHRKHRHKNNYQKLKDAIVYDDDRNDFVCLELLNQIKQGDHHHLIVSDEIRHIEQMYMRLESMKDRFYYKFLPGIIFLTGQTKDNKNVIAEIKEMDSVIIFATVAKEGLDIPQVDRIYLPWPSSNPKKVQQWLGRATRISEGKDDAVVFDFFDYLVPVLKKQFKRRRYQCYDQLDLEVRK